MLPVLGLAVALLLQPCCLAYTRSIMWVAAGEGVRVLAGAKPSEREKLVSEYVLRRLQAVPDVALFHMGGASDWQIETDVSDDGRVAQVSIRGHVTPLPLVGAGVQALYPHDGVGAVLEVRVAERVRPSWLEGGYDEWLEQWKQ